MLLRLGLHDTHDLDLALVFFLTYGGSILH